MVAFRGFSDRIALAVFKLDNNKTLNIIQVYAPTLATEDEEI